MNQCPDIMKTLRDGNFKDEKPLKTVERIKSILRQYGLETQERWNESSVPYCYSVRVMVVGTGFGTNGKGLTKEFALASGYGELIERFQLGYIRKGKNQKDGGAAAGDICQEKVPARQLLADNGQWYDCYARLLAEFTGEHLTPEALLNQYADAQGNVEVSAFYSFTSRRKEYLPLALRKSVYTTNGCAAGNTREEALVQAISEIVERHHKLRVITEGITPPDVPEEVLQSCKTAYRIIQYLRDHGFRVVIKDCSLETRFPVVCACIIDRATGKYHTHFGAAPDFEIALERTLTESFQGRNINNIAQYDHFCYKKEDAVDLEHLMLELVKGASEKVPSFFAGKPRYTYRKDMGMPGRNNRQILRSCLDYFREQGYEVLIRDCSCLGFPTYQVVIPGYSETFYHRLSQRHHDLQHKGYAERTLRSPADASMDDIVGFMMHVVRTEQMKGVGAGEFLERAGLSADISREEENFLMAATFAHVHYTLGNYRDTVRYIDGMNKALPGEDQEFLVCLKRYLSMVAHKYTAAEGKAVLEFFHQPETVARLYGILEGKGNPLDDYVLRCDMQCRETCRLYGRCYMQRTNALWQLIKDKTKELNFADMEEAFRDF